MRRRGFVAGIWLAFGISLPIGSSLAAGQSQGVATPSPSQPAAAQYRQAALKFLQSAQAYLGVTTLQWQNFMMVPRPGAVSEITSNNADYKAKVAAEFDGLMATPGGSEAISSKIKDYYAAWGLAFDSMGPTAADSARGFSTRTNAEMQRMDALAARVKMDL